MTAYIPQMEPVVTAADAAAVHAYLESGGWLTEFRETRRFEASLCEYTGARYCVAAPSGTLALFLALKAFGIGRDDEVIVPDLTMAASATAVILAGGTVRFADVEPETMCLDLAQAEQLISPRTRAVVLVSLNGRSPKDLPAFVGRCQARGVKVIEDAAQSLGSFHEDRHLGTIGDAGCLSFSSQKLVTTGQGGAVITNDEETYRRMGQLRDFGRLAGGSDHYLSVGWNLKFTDLQAVVGVSQLSRLPAMVEQKKEIFAQYREQLAGLDGIVVPATDLELVTPWFVDILVDPALKQPLIEYLHESGIGSRPVYPPLHAEPAFAVTGSYPVAADLSRRGLWLPSSLRLDAGQIAAICAAIRGFCRR
ncbi:MAG: DegT/DnrJ/EryC1/StrS family aminotransferase [Vicinamibacterales bacterium]